MAITNFTIRVELRDSEDADYETLHENMESNGFSRTIIGFSGTEYRLPSAEYIYKSKSETKKDVGALAHSIASKIKSHPRILVTESAGRLLLGLDEI